MVFTLLMLLKNDTHAAKLSLLGERCPFIRLCAYVFSLPCSTPSSQLFERVSHSIEHRSNDQVPAVSAIVEGGGC
jgi:hypothetical protein